MDVGQQLSLYYHSKYTYLKIYNDNIENVLTTLKISTRKHTLNLPWGALGADDQERVHTLVNRSCVLALRSVTYYDVRSDQTTTKILTRLSSGQRWWTY